MSKDNNIFITSHNQSGGVTAHTVNVGKPARQWNNESGEQLKQIISTSATITVCAVMGDAEALGFAHQIHYWLKSNGYTMNGNVFQSVYSKPVFGQELNKVSNTEYTLIIGSQE